MKKLTKCIFFSIIPVAVSSLFITSCSTKPSCNYIGNDTGTNWKGYTRGNLTLDFNDHDYTCSIKTNDGYETKDLYIPKQVKHNGTNYDLIKIEDSAFSFGENENNELLNGSLNFSTKMIDIGERSFEKCTKITTLNFSNIVMTIGVFAFAYCEKINNLDLPANSVLGSYCFSHCIGLTSKLIIDCDTQSYSEGIFSDCTNLTSIDVTCNKIGADWFKNCSNLVFADLESVGIIGESAFENCSKLQSVVQWGHGFWNYNEIQGCAFKNDTSLTTLNLQYCDNQINWYGDYDTYEMSQFEGCSNLSKIIFGTRSEAPTWNAREEAPKDTVFKNISESGDIEISGNWSSKTDVITFLNDWGNRFGSWTVNGE